MSIVRQPVVAVVGHIDHGKTTLLDYIRTTSVAAREAGGITQRVSAYEIVHTNAEGSTPMTFIDTPGHEAFQSMRRRSANAADIAILIVAADDGVKPQTKEALKAIQEAEVPFIVCFTKTDKEGASLEKAKESVLREGVYLEGLGGDVPWVAASGKTGVGIPELLDLIVLLTDVHAITVDTDAPFKAIVIESARDPRAGSNATMIIKAGTLTLGTFAVSGTAYAPVRGIETFDGTRVESLTAGKPTRITGFTDEPQVGSIITLVATKKEAEELTKNAAQNAKRSSDQTTEDDSKPLLHIVLKADSVGSVEALQYEINKIPHPDVEYRIVQASTGNISEADVKLLIGFTPSVILGFSTKVDAGAKDLAERQHIPIETRTIIYELSEWLVAETKKLEPDRSAETVYGVAKILKEFSVAGSKHVVGGRVEEGTLKRNDMVTIYRRGIEVGKGKIINLQEKKMDAGSVSAVTECGMQIDSKADIVAGDTIQIGGIAASQKKHG
jgi:translation initiation factor IF-2